jgi:nucleoside-triphosphatase THEP1
MVLVVAGPVHGGKTTFLERALPQWAARGLSCRGFLSLAAEDAVGAPVYDLLELTTGRRHPYLRRDGAPGAERIGPFVFVPETLALARSAVRGAGPDGLLVVDEVGPLEVGGGGLWPEVRIAALRAEGKLLLVARAEIVPDLVAALAPAVTAVFDIRDPGVRERLDEALFGTARPDDR